jgi:hypothetical protein
MTAHERLARPATVHFSRHRAQARNAQLRSNSDIQRGDACPKIPNGSASGHGTEVPVPRTVAPRLRSTPLVICRPLKSHR